MSYRGERDPLALRSELGNTISTSCAALNTGPTSRRHGYRDNRSETPADSYFDSNLDSQTYEKTNNFYYINGLG